MGLQGQEDEAGLLGGLSLSLIEVARGKVGPN
jgi:hypothetical protein